MKLTSSGPELSTAIVKRDPVKAKLLSFTRAELMHWVRSLDGLRNRNRADTVLAMLQVRIRKERLAVEKQQEVAEARLHNTWYGGKLLPAAEESKGGQPSHRKNLPLHDAKVELEPTLRYRWRQVATASEKLIDSYVENRRKAGEEITVAGFMWARTVAGDWVSQDEAGDEWCTPPEVIQMARACFGIIDLDPASNFNAQKLIRAREFWTKKDDGLKQRWHGRVWVNPPFVHPTVEQFAQKADEEYSSGHCLEILFLTHNFADTKWFIALAAKYALAFSIGRLKFWMPGVKSAARQGQALFYLGPDVAKFETSFRPGFYMPNRRVNAPA